MDCAPSLSLFGVLVFVIAAGILGAVAAIIHLRWRFVYRKASKIGRHEAGRVHLFGRLVAAEDAPMSLLSGKRAAYLTTDVRAGGTSVLRHVYGKKLTIADDTGTLGFAEQGVRFIGLSRQKQVLASAPAHAERELAAQFGLGPYPFPQNRSVRITERGLWAGDNVSVFGTTKAGRFTSPPTIVTDVRVARARASRRKKTFLGVAAATLLFASAGLLAQPERLKRVWDVGARETTKDVASGLALCVASLTNSETGRGSGHKTAPKKKTSRKRKRKAAPSSSAPVGRKKSGRAAAEAP